MPPLRVVIADDHQLFAETLGLDKRVDGSHATRLLHRLLHACPVVVLTPSPSSEDVHRARTVVAAPLEAGTCLLPPADHTESEAAQLHQVAQP